MFAGPNVDPAANHTPTSNLDVVPTLCDLAGIDIEMIRPWTDGQSLKPLMAGEQRTAPVCMEYAAEGSIAPMVAIRRGRFKYIHCPADPALLFDLDADPLEKTNLADDPAHAAIVSGFEAEIAERWDISAF